jgi:hypothetical protein
LGERESEKERKGDFWKKKNTERERDSEREGEKKRKKREE